MTDMERAQRAADGPRRLVIEASRLPAKPAPVAGPERTAQRPVAAVAAPKPGVAEKAPSPPPTAAAAQPAAAEILPAPVAAAASAAVPASLPVAERPAAPPPVEPTPAVPAPPAEPTVVAVVAPPPPAVPVPVPLAEPAPAVSPAPVVELAPLRLATMVEPTVPRRLAGRLRGELAAVVRFTVRPDGTVADAEVDESSHRQMDESVLEAVRQWRYAPPGAARPHAVRLTMKL